MEIDVQNNSGLGKEAELPQEVKHFNWGAFFLTWIWGVCNSAYLTLISLAFGIITWVIGVILWFVAIFGMASNDMSGMIFYCIYSVLVLIGGIALRVWFGVKGNQWAWQNKKWNSTEHFNRVQKQWVLGTIIAAVVLGFVVFAYIGVVAAMTMPTLLNSTQEKQYTVAYKRAMATIKQAVVMNYALEDEDFGKNKDGIVYNILSKRMNIARSDGNNLYFNDGIKVEFGNNVANVKGCTNQSDMTKKAEMRGSGVNSACKVILDVNGDKGPGIAGKDRFTICFVKQGVVPCDDAGRTIMKSLKNDK